MTKYHKFLFALWRIKMLSKGVYTGRRVMVYSNEKERYITGKVKQLIGVSCTEFSYAFDVDVIFDEPLMGNNPSFFVSSTYTESDFGSIIDTA
jgi:hypothetical protein